MKRRLFLLAAATLGYSWCFKAVAAPPPNDARAAAIVLPGALPLAVTGTNVEATREAGEPRHDDQTTHGSVWWRWTPTASGPVVVTTVGSNFDTVLAIYSEGAGGSLTAVASDDDSAQYRLTSAAEFPAVAGTVYYVAVASYGDTAQGAVSLSIIAQTTPAHDAFSLAATIPPTLPQWVFAPTIGLTVEVEEPFGFYPSVWWKWVAPQAGIYHLDGNGGAEAFTGPDLGDLENVIGYYAGDFVFAAELGETIYFRVVAYDPSQLLAVLTLRADSPPENDFFAEATPLAFPLPLLLTALLTDATSEPGEVDFAEPPIFEPKSAWWSFTPAASGTVELAVESEFSTSENGSELAAVTGTSLASLVPWAVGRDTDFLAFPVQAGVTYHLRAAVAFYVASDFSATLRSGPTAPANNALASATALTGKPLTVGGTIAGATPEPGETVGAEGTVWYRWTAPATEKISVLLKTGDETGAVFDFGTGTTVATFAPSVTGAVEAQVPVTAGSVYTIRVRGRYFAEDGGGFDLRIVGRPVNDDFAAATVLSGATAEASGTNLGAGVESGEPGAPGGPVTHSVWWKWVAPASGPRTVAAAVRPDATSQEDGRVTVFTGSVLAGLTTVAVGQGTAPAALNVIAGTTYSFRFDSERTGTVILAVSPRPANDAYAAAAALSGAAPVQSTGSVLGATPDATTAPDQGQSVWYSWTATWTGPASVKARNWTLPASFSVHVFTGVFPNLVPLGTTNGDAATFTATTGQNYRIRVDRGTDRIFSPADFSLLLVPQSANDLFADAAVLTGSSATVSGWTLGTSVEPGEPGRGADYVRFAPEKTAWWKWTAPASQLVVIDTFGSQPDTVLHVYTGSTLATLNLLRVCNDARAEKDSRVAFVAQAGTTYSIRVSGHRPEDEGAITLHLATSPFNLDAASLTAWGRSYLEGRTAADLDQADDHFTLAVSLLPTDPAANALRAVTRLARLQHDPALATLLAQWGVQTVRSTLHRPEYDTSYDGLGKRVAPAPANTLQGTQFLAASGLSTLTACEAHLAQITATSFTLPLSDSETAGRWLVVDYGDLQILRALGFAFQAAIRMNNTLDTDGSANALLDLENQRKLTAEHVIKLLPNLLKRRATDERGLFKTAIQQANARYQTASTFIRARPGTGSDPHHLFSIGLGQQRKEEELRENAAGFSQALDGTTGWGGHLVNLTPLLTTATPYRDFLPKFAGNLAAKSTAPDPSVQSSLAPGTHSQLNQILGDNHFLFLMSTFADWASVFLRDQSLAQQSPDADPDRDGLTNFGEFIFSLDPLKPSAPGEYQNLGLVAGTAGAKHFAITFVRRKAPAGATYKVWVSDSLATWDITEAQIEPVGTPLPLADDISEQVTYRLKLPTSAAPKKFLKIVGSTP